MNLNYKVEGSGETLVFIHGLSDNLLYWKFLADNLKYDYQVLRFDLRGHGESELGSDEITVGTYADDLYHLLGKLDIDNAGLIGFSLGGAVALDFAIKYPRMVSSLVLMSSFHKADDNLADILDKFKDALNNGFDKFYDLILPMVLCPDVISDNREELRILKKIAIENANIPACIKAAEACRDFCIESELSKINVSVLILAGRYDEISSLKLQKEMQSKIKDSRLIVFDNVKHNLLVGKNNEIILNILKKEFK